MAKKSLEERKAALEHRRQQIAAQLAKLDAQAKTQERKKDARQKIIVGGAVLAHARLDAAFAATLADILQKAVTRDVDRAVIADLLPSSDAQARAAT